VSDGIRTRDRRDHNPELYQLSYAHQADGQSSSAPRTSKGARRLDLTGAARYKRTMPLVMLVDTRQPFDDHREPAREPWALTVFDWVFPWPAAVVWLCVASLHEDGWAGAAMAYAAIVVAAWRGLRAVPTDGLDQNRQ
jgi:hypothetical protein